MKSTIKSMLTAAAVTLVATSAAQATTWEFKNGATGQGWVYDKTVPGSFPGQLGTISFANSANYVSVRNDGNNDKVVVIRSGQRLNAPMQGGGIERANTFNTNKMEARCRMVGANNEQIRRSQASFWQDTAGPNSTELDAFEIKPGANVVNFLSWVNGRRVGIFENAGSASYNWSSVGATQNWTNYKCTTNNRSKFDCFRNNGSKKTWTKLNNSVVGNTVILHNKPWRISQSNLSLGPVATLECDWVKN